MANKSKEVIRTQKDYREDNQTRQRWVGHIHWSRHAFVAWISVNWITTHSLIPTSCCRSLFSVCSLLSLLSRSSILCLSWLFCSVDKFSLCVLEFRLCLKSSILLSSYDLQREKNYDILKKIIGHLKHPQNLRALISISDQWSTGRKLLVKSSHTVFLCWALWDLSQTKMKGKTRYDIIVKEGCSI